MSLNIPAFLANVKKAAVDAVEASKPFALNYGEVTSVSPLKVLVDQKFELIEAQLILTNHVRAHWVDMTVDHLTELRGGGSGDSAYESHDHQYLGRKQYLVHCGLILGEKVILLRTDGGQKFIILDRVGPTSKGQSALLS